MAVGIEATGYTTLSILDGNQIRGGSGEPGTSAAKLYGIVANGCSGLIINGDNTISASDVGELGSLSPGGVETIGIVAVEVEEIEIDGNHQLLGGAPTIPAHTPCTMRP